MIAGQWIDGRAADGAGDVLAITNPADGSVIEELRLATAADVDAAVAAAKAAFPVWSRTAPAERGEVLHALARRLSERAEEYAQVESKQAGKPIRLTREFDVPGSIDNVVFFAGAARHLQGSAAAEWDGTHTSTVRREAIGVVGSIAPWNYPLQMAMWKMLPAVAAGNTIVLKPSELTPLTSLMLAEDATAVGMPDGVFNVITGTGPVAGEALIGHTEVRMVSFTGSTRVGHRVAEVAMAGLKRVHLELGGKAPFIVFEDADVEAAIQGAVAGSLINTGQDCTAATRAYVHRSLFDRFVDGVSQVMDAVVLGDTLDARTDIGPLISAAQQEKVAAMVERAVADGAKVACGGHIPQGPGCFYRPTLIIGAAQDSEIVQEEVFGPVLVALPFDDDDEAIRLANDTPYGLAASAWTTDVVRAHRASREVQAGCVWINDHIPIVSEMPHGGFKQSGFGKDMSTYSFEEYTQVKHVSFDITGDSHKPWHRTIFTGKGE
ncbi:MAG: gamma-aminobutyraldehyde dehydrogenase [Micrococcales bacterium]|nr:gamma-aminobutyraldehyde dehydrogenase [Micrococcales bacterium]